jgi:hypothetical protein
VRTPKQSHDTYKTCATAKITLHTENANINWAGCVVMNVCAQVHSPEGCQQLCACTTTPELCTTCSSSACCEWATGQACRKAPLTHVAWWSWVEAGSQAARWRAPGSPDLVHCILWALLMGTGRRGVRAELQEISVAAPFQVSCLVTTESTLWYPRVLTVHSKRCCYFLVWCMWSPDEGQHEQPEL